MRLRLLPRAFANLQLVHHQCGVRVRRCDRKCRCRHDRDLLDQLRRLLLGGSVCLNLGAGGGGATNAANRFMKSGANTLTYGLFTDAARSTAWGSNLWAGAGAPSVVVNFGVLGGGSASRTIFGRVFSGQQTVPAGSYLSAFSGLDASINVNCSGPATTTTFNVTATVPTTCTVATNNLNFGTAGVLTANTDATTTLSPTCTNGTPYNIGLNGGLSGAADPTQRKMTKAAEFVLVWALPRCSPEPSLRQ